MSWEAHWSSDIGWDLVPPPIHPARQLLDRRSMLAWQTTQSESCVTKVRLQHISSTHCGQGPVCTDKVTPDLVHVVLHFIGGQGCHPILRVGPYEGWVVVGPGVVKALRACREVPAQGNMDELCTPRREGS